MHELPLPTKIQLWSLSQDGSMLAYSGVTNSGTSSIGITSPSPSEQEQKHIKLKAKQRVASMCWQAGTDDLSVVLLDDEKRTTCFLACNTRSATPLCLHTMPEHFERLQCFWSEPGAQVLVGPAGSRRFPDGFCIVHLGRRTCVGLSLAKAQGLDGIGLLRNAFWSNTGAKLAVMFGPHHDLLFIDAVQGTPLLAKDHDGAGPGQVLSWAHPRESVPSELVSVGQDGSYIIDGWFPGDEALLVPILVLDGVRRASVTLVDDEYNAVLKLGLGKLHLGHNCILSCSTQDLSGPECEIVCKEVADIELSRGILPHVQHLGLTHDGKRACVFWCPGDLIPFPPVHAAVVDFEHHVVAQLAGFSLYDGQIQAAWSPCGRFLAVLQDNNLLMRDIELCVYDLDLACHASKQPKRRTSRQLEPSLQCSLPPFIEHNARQNWQWCWSADGCSIVVLIVRSSGSRGSMVASTFCFA